MKAQKRIKHSAKAFYTLAVYSMVIVSLLCSSTVRVNAATSGQLRSQIEQLQALIDANAAKAKELATQADSLKKTIAGLDVQINQAQAQIDLTAAKIAELQEKLDQTQKELDRQKDLLKASMRMLYKKGGASPLELLAASDSFSSFINDQEYLERLKTGIQSSTEAVIALKQQIQEQKIEQENLIKLQEEQKRALDATRADRQAVLDKTQGDEQAYRDMMSQQIAQQKEVNRQLFLQIQLERGDSNKGGYPYANWPFSMQGPGCPSGDGPDRWGYCTRQCVSYAAWAVERSGRRAPYGYGDANMWVSAARSDGISVDTTPRAGDVAIYTGGTWGHAQYVEAVYGDGTMRISQFNAMLDGDYSEATVSAYRGNWYYIHFP